MKTYFNPYYDASKLGLQTFIFEEGLDYAFNILLFVKTPEGLVYTGTDSGCSCPTPFEEYSGSSLDAVLQNMERVGSVDQAERIFDAWRKPYAHKEPIAEKCEFNALRCWMGVPVS